MNKHLQNKKRIMLLFVAFFMGIGASWAYDYDFSAIAPSGQTLYYDIISSTDHTVGLVSPNEAYQEVPYVIGDLIIPSEVSYDGEIYTVTALLNNHHEGAFQMTGITSVVIPETVNNVQAAAFYQSTALTTIICLATTPPSSSGGGYEYDTWASFYGLSENCVLYVPEGSFESYQADDYWGSRLPVQAIDGQPHEIIAIAMPTEGGMVSGEGTYEWNSACTLTATPNEGYIFLYWTEDGVRVSNDAEYSFNVTSDRNLEAHFVEEGSMCNLVVQLFDSYGDGWNGNKLVVSHGDESSEEITLSGGSSGEQTITVINGDHITLTWINGQYIGECSFNICYSNGNVIYHGENMSSNFSYEFDVDCEEIPGTTGNDGTLTVYDGTVQNEGMPIIGWGACYLFKCEYVMPASDLAPMKESLITSMTCYNTDSNVSYGSASFKVFMKEVDFENLDDSDVFQGYEDGTVVYEGSLFLSSQGLLEIEFTTPYYYQGGNLLIGVYNCVKGNRVGWSYFYGQTLSHETGFVSTLNEGDDINLLTGPGFRETFMPKTTFTFTELNGAYNITSMSSPIEGGTVTGAGEYALGETCTLMATPNEGYTFVNWTEDGEEVSTDPTYLFTVAGERSLTANFSLNSYEVTAVADPMEGGTVEGAGAYNHFDECTLTAIANEGYAFVNWTENGEEVSTDPEYSFTVTSDRELTAVFAIQEVFPIGAINSTFAVNENGDKVCFSIGNLQYQASTNTWRFAENQYDIVGSANSNISQTYSGFIDLFGWGTSGWNNGNSNYQPWCSTNAMNQWTFYGPYGLYDLTEQYANSDWGVYNSISNGGNESGIWRTLSKDEWDYVINSRITSSGIRYAKAKVNEVCGLVLLPDLWDSSCYTFNSPNDGEADFDSNTISQSEWEEVLQINGAVFLPSAGARVGQSLVCENRGSYWSSSYFNDSNSYSTFFDGTNCAYAFYVYESELIIDYNHRCDGLSVRLVSPVTLSYYSINATPNPAEGGTVSGMGEYALGVSVTLTATANEGYTFVNWTENGEVVSTDAEYSFTVTCNRDLIANFMSDVVNNDESSLTVCDGTVTNECFPVTGWCINQYGKQEYVMPSSMLAEMNGSCITSMKCYSSNYSSVSYGSAYFQVFMKEVDSATISEYQGMEDATIVYEGSLSVSNGELLINFTTPYCYHGGNLLIGVYNPVKASFQIFNGRFYGITVQDSDICGWDPNSIDNIFGSNGQFWNFLPKTTFTYVGMEGVFNVTTIPAPAVGGTVSGAGAYAWDETCVLTALANEGYIFDNWTENGEVVSTEAEYSFTVYGDRILVANFIYSTVQPDYFNINAAPNPSEGGVVTGDGYYEFGSLVTLTATANEGFSFVSWIENGEEVSADATYTFTVTGERNLLANFTVAETSEVNHWTPNSSSFANNMTLTGVIMIDGVEQTSDRLELGAFCGEQCRGSQSASCFGPTQRYVVQITIFGEMGDQISFRLYDHETEQELDLASPAPVNFNTDGYGNLLNPYVLNFISSFASSQTTPLTEGWNWWSSYIELSGINGLALVENSLGEHGLLIKSRENGYVESFENNGSLMWFGTLKSINNEQLYMIRTNAACEVSVTGEPANPENHPITLNPGWNWIGFPCQQPMSVGTAMSGITPEGDDIVKGRNGYASYYAGDGNWYGTLNTLEPGQGYMYQSLGDEAKTLVYNTNRSETTSVNVTPEHNMFKPYAGDYANNMTLTAVVELNGHELRQEGYELAAFVGDECRGSVKLLWVAPLDRYVAFLTVFGEQDETMTFRLTDGTAIATAAEKQSFTVDATLGTLTSPVVLRFGNLGIDDSVMPQVSVYPNPSDGVFQVEGTGIERVEVYNTLGQRVFMEKAKADMMSVDLRAQAEGLYTLRVVTADGVSVHNIVKR